MQSLERLYLSYNLDPRQAKLLIGKIAETRLAMLKATMDRHVQMRKILTEDQFKTLVSSIPPPRETRASDSGLRRWGGGGHPPSPPH
jgi:hypothetical protein